MLKRLLGASVERHQLMCVLQICMDLLEDTELNDIDGVLLGFHASRRPEHIIGVLRHQGLLRGIAAPSRGRGDGRDKENDARILIYAWVQSLFYTALLTASYWQLEDA